MFVLASTRDLQFKFTSHESEFTPKRKFKLAAELCTRGVNLDPNLILGQTHFFRVSSFFTYLAISVLY